MRIVVVLPAPFGPSRPNISPGRTSRSIAVDGEVLAEARRRGPRSGPRRASALAPQRVQLREQPLSAGSDARSDRDVVGVERARARRRGRGRRSSRQRRRRRVAAGGEHAAARRAGRRGRRARSTQAGGGEAADEGADGVRREVQRRGRVARRRRRAGPRRAAAARPASRSASSPPTTARVPRRNRRRTPPQAAVRSAASASSSDGACVGMPDTIALLQSYLAEPAVQRFPADHRTKPSGPVQPARARRQIGSPLFLAHIRAATGTPVEQTNCHPFRHGRWLFMHNGFIDELPRAAPRAAARGRPVALLRHRRHDRLRADVPPRADVRARGGAARRRSSAWPASSRRPAAATASRSRCR